MSTLALVMAMSALLAWGRGGMGAPTFRGATLGASPQSPLFPCATDAKWWWTGHCGGG